VAADRRFGILVLMDLEERVIANSLVERKISTEMSACGK